MTIILIWINFLTGFNLPVETSERVFPFQGRSHIRLSSYPHSLSLIEQPDYFLTHMSPFDLTGRLRGKKNPTPSDYINFAKNQVGDWDNEEAEKFRRMIIRVDKMLADHHITMHLPDTIDVVKSTCREEGGAIGYTRDNFMVMSDAFIYEDVFIHELFHIFSRHNPEIRKLLFESLGFKKCEPIRFDPAVFPHLMTNPDAPIYDYYLTVTYRKVPVDVVMTVMGKSEYDGGSFFSYMDKKLVVLEKNNDVWIPKLDQGKPVLLGFDEVEGLYEQIGDNTEFNIQPEEICAEHFIILLKSKKNLVDPDLIKKMEKILQEN